MPFPLAHPAAVLPLRRYCPQWFNFPALVIGSLCPDAGYCFGALHLEKFSHRFLAGSFGFCLPLGLLLLQLFYLLRRPVVQWLPANCRRIFEPHCARPQGPLLVMLISLLVGAWTHIFLDSITHADGSLAPLFTFLPENIVAGNPVVPAWEMLYAVGTFLGVAYVGFAYLAWIDRAAGAPGWIFPGFKWVAAALLAALSLLLSSANHAVSDLRGLAVIGILSVTLMIGWLLVTCWALRNPENQTSQRAWNSFPGCRRP